MEYGPPPGPSRPWLISRSNLSLQSTPHSRSKGADGDLPLSSIASERCAAAPADEPTKHVLSKIDWNLIPMLLFTYMLNFMDKSILANAAVFGLVKDTHLVGNEYSWVSSVFYFGYLFWEYPTSYLLQKLPTGKYVGANTLFWGTAVAVSAACRSYGALITVRLLLGVAEASTSPAFVHIMAMWYTRSEIPMRTGLWFAGNSAGSVVYSFISFGLGHIKKPLSPWMWNFIVSSFLFPLGIFCS